MMLRQNNHRAPWCLEPPSGASHVSDGELLVLCHLGLELRRRFFGKGGRVGLGWMQSGGATCEWLLLYIG